MNQVKKKILVVKVKKTRMVNKNNMSRIIILTIFTFFVGSVNAQDYKIISIDTFSSHCTYFIKAQKQGTDSIFIIQSLIDTNTVYQNVQILKVDSFYSLRLRKTTFFRFCTGKFRIKDGGLFIDHRRVLRSDEKLYKCESLVGLCSIQRQ